VATEDPFAWARPYEEAYRLLDRIAWKSRSLLECRSGVEQILRDLPYRDEKEERIDQELEEVSDARAELDEALSEYASDEADRKSLDELTGQGDGNVFREFQQGFLHVWDGQLYPSALSALPKIGKNAWAPFDPLAGLTAKSDKLEWAVRSVLENLPAYEPAYIDLLRAHAEREFHALLEAIESDFNEDGEDAAAPLPQNASAIPSKQQSKGIKNKPTAKFPPPGVAVTHSLSAKTWLDGYFGEKNNGPIYDSKHGLVKQFLVDNGIRFYGPDRGAFCCEVEQLRETFPHVHLGAKFRRTRRSDA